jgi:hypothetical protein
MMKKHYTDKEIEKHMSAMYLACDEGVADINSNIICQLKAERDSLVAWNKAQWLKGAPEVGATVLIKHCLGAGSANYDVASYTGREPNGDDRFMMPSGTAIFAQDVLRYRFIEDGES